jgi:hypothetical protein
MRQLFFFIAACVCLTDNVRADYNDFETNPYISAEARESIRPFLLPEKHKMRQKLDKIFHATRACFDSRSLKKAGFDIKYKQPRSRIYVVSHESLPGYLLKLVPDVDDRQKGGKPEWFWFVNRCKGVEKIHEAIKKHHVKYFAAPKKWIYPLPVKPYPEDKKASRKVVILLVEDMLLTSKEENRIAWKKEITKKHLDELYLIMRDVGGSSYRAQNIPQTKKGTFAFIDTEYPTSPPGYKDIRRYLSSGKRLYWDNLVDAGR